MTFGTIGSIATHIAQTIEGLPAGVSGALVQLVDLSRQNVENYVGIAIGSNSIEAQYEPAIISFAKAETLNLVDSNSGGTELKLADLSIGGGDSIMNSEQYKKLGDMQLNLLGRKVKFDRSLS